MLRFKALRCLVVEDNLVNQMVLQRMLKMVHVSCDKARNGVEALAATEAKQYDVILMVRPFPLPLSL